ncbi:MAG: DUF6111 family protein [Methylobacterium frigidaeris]
MIRSLLDEVLLFLAPFGIYGLYLLLRRRNPFAWIHWSDQAMRLAIVGAVLVVAWLLQAGLSAERHPGGFVPTHIENGRVVPGQFR